MRGATGLPDQDTMRRLAFIRYMHTLGIAQSRQPEPLGAVAVLTFHDSVELFLHLASEYLDTGSSNMEFIAYFEKLALKLPPNGLVHKESMRRLNKSRVGLKHAGTLPSRLDIEGFRGVVTSFFQDNTPLVFGLAFESISMIELVQHKEARELLHVAARLLSEDKRDNALENIALSFDQLISTLKQPVDQHHGDSPFELTPSFAFNSAHFLGLRGERIGEFVDKTIAGFAAVENAIMLVGLGVDYRRYLAYMRLVPEVFWTMDGKVHTEFHGREGQATAGQCRFCLDFVVESALRLENDPTVP